MQFNDRIQALLDEVEAEGGLTMRDALHGAIAKHVSEADEPETDPQYVLMKLALVKDAVRDEHREFIAELLGLECTRRNIVGGEEEPSELVTSDSELYHEREPMLPLEQGDTDDDTDDSCMDADDDTSDTSSDATVIVDRKSVDFGFCALIGSSLVIATGFIFVTTMGLVSLGYVKCLQVQH